MSINWRKPLEWSTGEEASLAPYDNAYDGHRHVSGCKEWLNITGDNYVAVNATTGQVLGCEDDYPHIRNKAEMTNLEINLCEAATCLWEQALALIHKGDLKWTEYQEGFGYSSLRYDTLVMARACHEDWLVAEADGYDYPFDWEFVPAWMDANIIWGDTGPELCAERTIPKSPS